MHTKRRKICEVLVSTTIIAVMTVTLFWVYSIIRNWQGQSGVGSLLVGFLGGIFFGLLTMGVYIVPSAFVASLVIASLKRWSLKGVATLLLVVVISSSVSAYLLDPTQSRPDHGPVEYFLRFDWFVSQFTLTAVITGFVASLIAFWAVLRCRRRYQTASGVAPQQCGIPTNRKLRITLPLALGTGVALALLGASLFWFHPRGPGGSLHVFHISETQTFLTEEIALDKAGEALAMEGLSTALWKPYEYKRTAAPDGKPDRYLLRYDGKSGAVMFVNATNQMASCSVEIQLEGNRLTCRVFKRD
jgi:hypothetical protein